MKLDKDFFTATDKAILLFDGDCKFCSRWVNILIRNDKYDVFRFATLKHAAVEDLLQRLGMQEVPSSVLLIYGNNIYSRSDVIIKTGLLLRGRWVALALLKIVPRFIRNAAYDFVARNRYKWFGRRESCYLPEKKYNHKFL